MNHEKTSVRFNMVMPRELRDRTQAAARSAGCSESAVLKMAVTHYLAAIPAERHRPASCEPTTRNRLD